MMGGASLATLDQENFQNVARKIANRSFDDDGVWIGYYELSSTEPYQWLESGEKINMENKNIFEKWRAGEPNNGFVERTDLQVCSHAPFFLDLNGFSGKTNFEECVRRAAEAPDVLLHLFFQPGKNKFAAAWPRKTKKKSPPL